MNGLIDICWRVDCCLSFSNTVADPLDQAKVIAISLYQAGWDQASVLSQIGLLDNINNADCRIRTVKKAP